MENQVAFYGGVAHLGFDGLSVPTISHPAKRHRAAATAAPPLSFLGEDISFAIRQQQLEVDRFVSLQTEKVRRELWERRRLHSRRIAGAVERWVARRVRAKEEEIERMGRLNAALEERVRSLCAENQIWRELAQANEAAANALRADLEQVLAQGETAGDDAESWCDNFGGAVPAAGRRLCRLCGAAEPSVLLLPCRHLCLCAACGPAVASCPVCTCDKNGSVNVNIS